MKLLITLSLLLVGGISTTACLAAAAVADPLSLASSSYTIPESIVNGTATSAISTTTPFFMPSGCTCKQSSLPSDDNPAASSNNNDDECHQFDCDCQCDLTAGVCDINCCCDPECSASEIVPFTSCLDEGEGPSPIVKMCVERPPSLEAVNLQYPLRLSDSPEVSILCLVWMINSTFACPNHCLIHQYKLLTGQTTRLDVRGEG